MFNHYPVFYIESPFQLLQVHEVIQLKEINQYKILIKLNENSVNNNQMKALVIFFNLDNVTYYRFSSLLTIVFDIYSITNKCLFAASLYVGDHNSPVFWLLKPIFSKSRTTLMDDGVGTIIDGRQLGYSRFSIFNGLNDPTIVNNFDALSKKMTANQYKVVDIILGGKLVETGISTLNDYLDMIESMLIFIKLRSSRDILYIAHRGEEIINLNIIEKKFGLEVIRPTFPAELIAEELKVRPNLIGTVLSTAVFSMSKIYNKSRFFILKPKEGCVKQRKKYIDALFDYIDKYTEHQVIEMDRLEH